MKLGDQLFEVHHGRIAQNKSIVGAGAFHHWGRLKEIQGAANDIVSPAVSYTTGSPLVIDGSWCIPRSPIS